jgi:sensor histidine kinase YesM
MISVVLFTVVLIYIRGDFSFSDINLTLATSILITIAFLAISVYINLLWLIPTFFSKRRFFLFIILQLGNILLFILLNYYATYFFEGGGHPNFLAEFIAEFILVMIFLIVSTLLKFMRDSIALHDVELKMKDVEKQKVEAELRVLKAQVNPHFFFNTLNSLYSLSLDKSDKTPEMILKLSELMRHVIYESKDEQVSIGRQIEFFESYVFLEKHRMDEALDLKFEIKGTRFEMKVAPLLFIVFIENAFKHGSRSRESKPYIHIGFDISQADQVIFTVQNSVDSLSGSGSQGGFGLENVRKRLNLLYPGRHLLNIRREETYYRVELTISIP